MSWFAIILLVIVSLALVSNLSCVLSGEERVLTVGGAGVNVVIEILLILGIVLVL